MIDNYYKLRNKLAHKIVDRARGEKDPEEFQQNVKEVISVYIIDCIIFAATKLKLEE